jgi:hypothetical protein
MNERINGLWWKARIGYNNQNCDPEVLEKFAELIVRECVDTYDHWAKHSMDKNAFVVAKTHVKEHFGVEQ